MSPEQSHYVPFDILENFLTNSNIQMSIIITTCVAILTVAIVLFFGIWKYKSKVLPSQSEAAERKYRFRKRDKVIFYGRKMLRKVRSFTRNTMGVGPSGLSRRKSAHKLMLSKWRKFLNKRDSSLPQLKKKAPPSKFLEADWSDFDDMDPRLPPEIFYLLRSVRVFGHLEKPFFLELCKFMESVKVPAGEYLFNVGDTDNCIYVVQSGLVEVYIREKDGDEHLVKVVRTGDSIHSLLSILDVLTGHPAPYKTVLAKAVVDSTILKLPALAFNSMFERFNESVVRMVQIIMIRLQRVTFMALHNYLGLSHELINHDIQSDVKSLHIHALSRAAVPCSPIKSTSGKAIHLSMSHDEDSGSKMSDFNTALMRARVSDSKDEYGSAGTPTRRSSADDSAAAMASRAKGKRQSIPGDVFACDDSASQPAITQPVSDAAIIELAKKDIINLLGLKDGSLLDDKVSLRRVKAGTLLCKQGDQDVDLLFVVKGTLHVMQQMVGESAKEVKLFSKQAGEMMGTMAVLTGEPSFFSVRSKTDAILAVITKSSFYSIMREEPFIVLNTSILTVRRMSAFVRQIDFALDWQMVEAGKALFRQGDTSDSVYIILTGRLRSVITLVGGKKEVVGEYGRGELVGIVEVLTHTERATTVMAIRDTEVAKIPEELLTLIKLKYPQVVTRLIHLLGQRLLGNLQSRNTVALGQSLSQTLAGGRGETQLDNAAMVANLATVAVLPVTSDVPVENFTLELQHALSAIGSTTRLTSDIIKERLGPTALDAVNEFRLSSWLNQQEDIHRMVLYQCDSTVTKWTKHCIRQADAILIVTVAEAGPTVGAIEKELENIAVRAQKELILLHKEDADTPRGTAEWLNARGWCSSYHHIRCNKRVFTRKSLEKRLQMYQKLSETEPDRLSDFSRLARFLTGTSIGLVLGGGGARGLAHVGMIKAMQEAGIPVDMVGGTSMGSFIGALWAEERTYPRFNIRAREWAFKMTSIWKKVLDLTYPYTSMFTGGSFNEVIESTFRDRQIEDLWIPYFCVTTDISNSSMRIHTSGSLWRYVRASMSLSGYLPPLCDPVDGHLLLDGGYVNNLPADVLRTMGAQTIFAIDVGSQDDTTLTNYGDKLSGWWLLWKRWNPWSSSVRVPDMTEIQSRLAYVSCTRQLEVVKNSDYTEYIRPPIDKYGTLQFGSYDEIVDVGFNHGKTLFSGWAKGGLLNNLFLEKHQEKTTTQRKQQDTAVPVMAYFTDLAELVSRIEKPQSKFYIDTESELGTDDELNARMDAEDDEYIYDDDIIVEEGESDAMQDSDGDEHCPESDKPLQTASEPGFQPSRLEENAINQAEPDSLTAMKSEPLEVYTYTECPKKQGKKRARKKMGSNMPEDWRDTAGLQKAILRMQKWIACQQRASASNAAANLLGTPQLQEASSQQQEGNASLQYADVNVPNTPGMQTATRDQQTTHDWQKVNHDSQKINYWQKMTRSQVRLSLPGKDTLESELSYSSESFKPNSSESQSQSSGSFWEVCSRKGSEEMSISDGLIRRSEQLETIKCEQAPKAMMEKELPVTAKMARKQQTAAKMQSEQPAAAKLEGAKSVAAVMESPQPVAVKMESPQPAAAKMQSLQPAAAKMQSQQPADSGRLSTLLECSSEDAGSNVLGNRLRDIPKNEQPETAAAESDSAGGSVSSTHIIVPTTCATEPSAT